MRADLITSIRRASMGSAVQNFRVAERAWEFLVKISADAVDLILVDHQLQGDGMSGLDFIRRLKSSPLTRHIPAIMITSTSTRKLREEARAAGAVGFYTKPLNESVAPEIIAGLIQMSREHRRTLHTLHQVLAATGSTSAEEFLLASDRRQAYELVPSHAWKRVQALSQAIQGLSAQLGDVYSTSGPDRLDDRSRRETTN